MSTFFSKDVVPLAVVMENFYYFKHLSRYKCLWMKKEHMNIKQIWLCSDALRCPDEEHTSCDNSLKDIYCTKELNFPSFIKITSM